MLVLIVSLSLGLLKFQTNETVIRHGQRGRTPLSYGKKRIHTMTDKNTSVFTSLSVCLCVHVSVQEHV